MPEDPEGRVGHGTLRIDGATIMLSDAYPDYGAIAPEPGNKAATFALNLYVPDVDAVMKAAEEAGATIQRPAADHFHEARMGTLIDPFGVRWMIATHKRNVPADELSKAAAEFAKTGAEPGPMG